MIDNKNNFNNNMIIEEYIKFSKVCGLWKSEFDVITSNSSFSDRVLDVGCGTGRIVNGLEKLGYTNLYAIDNVPAMIKAAIDTNCSNSKIKFNISNIVTECLFEDEFFDLIIFGYNGLMSICGVENRKKAINNITKMLKKNGIFIFTFLELIIAKTNKWYYFWESRKKHFIDNGLSVNSEEFGDLIVEDKGYSVYHHFATRKEIFNMLNGELKVIDFFTRSQRFLESKEVLSLTNDCVFVVCQKND